MLRIFGRRKEIVVVPDPPPSPEYKRMRQEFAELCAFGAGKQEHMCYERGLMSFDDLCRLPWLQQGGVAINTEEHQLLLGTETVCLQSKHFGTWHEIGEFVVTIHKRPASFTCINITPARHPQGNHHPHVNASGTMCIDHTEICGYIGSGELVEAARIILIALHTTNGHPYADVEQWPEAPYKETRSFHVPLDHTP